MICSIISITFKIIENFILVSDTYSKAQAIRMKLKKVWDIFLFLIPNVIINSVDVITDIMTAYALCKYIIMVDTRNQ